MTEWWRGSPDAGAKRAGSSQAGLDLFEGET